MGSDNREWYRDWWRKKTGYVERSAFRVSESDRKRAAHASAWRKNWIVLAVVVGVLVVLVLLKRL